MDINQKCNSISNSLYNVGLDRVRLRDLSSASVLLKRSLSFNKKNIAARNLLGLVYYEMGEVACALVQWVISLNLEPERNDAEFYIDELRRKSGKLETYNYALEKYNMGLKYAQNNNEDLAVLQLRRAVDSNKSFIKARLLLALIYMKHEEYGKSNREVTAILRIEPSNSLALSLDSMLRSKRKPTPQQKEKEKKEVTESDIINPPIYREGNGIFTVVNILMGLLIGASAILFLYMPTKTSQLNVLHNAEINKVNEQLSEANERIRVLTDEQTSIQNKSDSVNEQLNTIEESTTYKLTQYQKMIGILYAYLNNDMVGAADLYATLDGSQIQDIDDSSGVSLTSIYSSISTRMNAEGYLSLSNKGDEAYAAGDYTAAIDYYDKCLNINSNYAHALLRKALSYKQLGDLQNANNLFGDVILKFPNTEYATRAKSERGY